MFDPVLPLGGIAQRLKMHFIKAVGKGVLHDAGVAQQKIRTALETQGAIVFGETHGVYSHADFVTQFMPQAKAAGADRLYVEMFYQRHQPVLDAWQDDGDASGLIWLMNKSPSYAEKMWPRFWQVLQAANENGLRIVTIEPDKKPQLYPGMSIFFRNMKWQDTIEADQKAKKNERPFVLYCGSHHLNRSACANTRPIHLMLNAAGLAMDSGEFCLITPRNTEKPAYMSVPRAYDQTPLTHLKMYRNEQIQYKGLSPS